MQRLSLALLPFLALPAAGQTATALLREGDVLPSGDTVTALNNTAVNQNGGYAATLSASGGAGTISAVWGNLAGGSGSVLRSEMTIGNFEQTSFESFFGISQSEIAYSPSCIDTVSGTTGLDGVWVNDSIQAIEEQASSVPGEFYSFGSRPGITQSGMPYFVGGTTPTQGGSTANRALFFGPSNTVLLISGQVVPGLPFPLSANSVDFDFRVSAMGSHYIAPVDIDTASTEDFAIVIDGAGLFVGGSLVQEGMPLPASAGGLAGENWDNFDNVGINEAGDYYFTGDTDGDSATDEFLFKNGNIVAREGDTIDGFVVEGSIEGAFMNESGDIAYVWDVDDGGTNVEALFLNQDLLIKEGDSVDWDGDGTVDPGFVLLDFTGISAVTLSANGVVYLTADIDVAGATLEGYFAIGESNVGTNYCMTNPNSTGVEASIAAVGSTDASANNLSLMASDMPAGQFGFFINSLTQGFIANPGTSQGNLCVIGNIGRYNANIFLSTPAGTGGIILDLTMTPTPSGNVAIMAGETWNFQGWFRDQNPGLTSNFTDGVSVTFN